MRVPMTVNEIGAVVEDLLAEYRRERTRLDTIAAYVANRVVDIYVPRKATSEYRMLVDQARFNVLPRVVQAMTQNLYIDGYRPTGPNGRAPSKDNAPIWDSVWQPNRMDARQAGLWRPTITYGYSYALVLPGELDGDEEGDGGDDADEPAKKPVPVITPYSPRKLTALYDDPVNDEWPQVAMVAQRPVYRPAEPGADPLADPTIQVGTKLTIYDDEFRYRVVKGREGGWELLAQVERHGLGVVPVVRFLDEQGCDDLPSGKVWPLLPAQQQLNQTTFNLLMAQQYAAFRQRWVTGMAIDDDENGVARESFNPRVDAILQAEKPDTKFGEFGQTDLSGYIDSRRELLLYVASVAPLPPHHLVTGAGISNISADALVALQTTHDRDIDEHKTTLGESVEQMFRLAGLAKGGPDGHAAWDDTSAQVVWRDTTPRSLTQVADALLKLAKGLEIPYRALWEKIPGVTDQDIERWEAMAEEDELMRRVDNMVDQDRGPTQETTEETGAVGDGGPADAAA